jgi:hypothetical protein
VKDQERASTTPSDWRVAVIFGKRERRGRDARSVEGLRSSGLSGYTCWAEYCCLTRSKLGRSGFTATMKSSEDNHAASMPLAASASNETRQPMEGRGMGPTRLAGGCVWSGDELEFLLGSADEQRLPKPQTR